MKLEITINLQGDTQSDILSRVCKQGLRIATLEDQPAAEPAPSGSIEIPGELVKMLRSQAKDVNSSVRALNGHSKGRIQSRVYPAGDVDNFLYRVETLLVLLEKSLHSPCDNTLYNKM